MANVKFTDLSSATTPDGTEIACVVQGGTSKKVTLANMVPGLTAIVNALWTVSLSVGAEAGNKIIVTATLKDLNNVTLTSAKVLAFTLVSAADASYAVSDEGSGTGLSSGTNNVSVFTTNASGVAQIGFTDTAAETIQIVFFTPQGPVQQALTFAP